MMEKELLRLEESINTVKLDAEILRSIASDLLRIVDFNVDDKKENIMCFYSQRKNIELKCYMLLDYIANVNDEMEKAHTNISSLCKIDSDVCGEV